MVSKNSFREDLLYRINTIQIELPSLKDRPEDIPLLAKHFLNKYGKKYNKPGLKINDLALDKLFKYHWPGNVRELEHLIEKTVILCDSEIIGPEDFLFHTGAEKRKENFRSLNLFENEQYIIKLAIEKNKGNLSRTCSELGITRKTLYNKIKKYDL